MPKGTFKPYLLCELFIHEKAGFPQTNEESPPFFVYRIKSRFSVKRRNPNPSPTWKIKFGFLSFGPSGESRTRLKPSNNAGLCVWSAFSPQFSLIFSCFKTKNRRPDIFLAACFYAYYSTRNRRVITISCVVSSPFISSTLS